jgi:hypothetical protein
MRGLKFQIHGSDREILRGWVPSVEVQAEQIVYQGLHLSQAALSASQIQINLGQVLQGKPLRLLEVVPVVGTVRFTQADLSASMTAPLLKQALVDFFTLVVNHLDQELLPVATELTALYPLQLQQPQIQLVTNGLMLTAELLTPNASPAQLVLEAQLQISQGSLLQFMPLKICCALPDQQPIVGVASQPLIIDLGAEVHLQKLNITPEQILCEGRMNVASAD